MKPVKRHDTRLLYINGSVNCPYRLSVRLPTWVCDRGCTYCCRGQWVGNKFYAQKYELSQEKFVELWTRIMINDDWRFVYPRVPIKYLWEKTRTLRYVREDLFCRPISRIRNLVLNTHIVKKIGMVCKTASLTVSNSAYELRKFPHCIIMNVSPMAKDYKDRIRALTDMVESGITTTAGIQPVTQITPALVEILDRLPAGLAGVQVALYRGQAEKVANYLLKKKYKRVHTEDQYTPEAQRKIYQHILRVCRKKGLNFGTYYSSPYHIFNDTKACCIGI